MTTNAELFSDIRTKTFARPFSRTARAMAVVAIVEAVMPRQWVLSLDLEHLTDGFTTKTLTGALTAAVSALYDRAAFTPAEAQAIRAALATLSRDPWSKKPPQLCDLQAIRQSL